MRGVGVATVFSWLGRATRWIWYLSRMVVFTGFYFVSLWVFVPLGLVLWPFLSIIALVFGERHRLIGPKQSFEYVFGFALVAVVRALGLADEFDDLRRPKLGEPATSSWGQVIGDAFVVP